MSILNKLTLLTISVYLQCHQLSPIAATQSKCTSPCTETPHLGAYLFIVEQRGRPTASSSKDVRVAEAPGKDEPLEVVKGGGP